VLVLVLLAFGPSLFGEFISWDDDLLVFENPVVQAMTPWTLWKIFTMYDPELYIPLTFFSYQINYLIGGMSPFVYHLTNILLHAGNALLVTQRFSRGSCLPCIRSTPRLWHGSPRARIF